MFFFFNDTATTEIYTLSLHDALPISVRSCSGRGGLRGATFSCMAVSPNKSRFCARGRLSESSSSLRKSFRSEEHTSELQSLRHLLCRLLLEKKKEDYILFRHFPSVHL